ncbi:MAG: radical SAM protein [Candidatus Zixiibacteriota bacterium]
MSSDVVYHIANHDWRMTPSGEPRGYIQPTDLRELWFHTGSVCNLECPFCFEGSHPGDNRIGLLTFDDFRPFAEEAIGLSVQQFSFTGGEPFVNRDIVRMLDYSLDFCETLVLTNGTKPLASRLDELVALTKKPHKVSFRVSLDYPDAQRHDSGRGKGSFDAALSSLAELHRMGFGVSIARLASAKERTEEIERVFRSILKNAGLPDDLYIAAFPDYAAPGSKRDVPDITENCMATFKTEQDRTGFMCSYSKMVAKTNGAVGVVACTLVDDDPDYMLGRTLTSARSVRIMLRHHRCFACFSVGATCSE